MDKIPFPPPELLARAGRVEDFPEGYVERRPWLRGDPESSYDRIGRELRERILSLLPADWSFEGKAVLDFGCGAGRVLRQLVSEAERGEVWGCDLDRASIEWLGNLSPPLRVFVNDEAPPLPLPRGHFDLIYAISVFTHITDGWSDWLVELHRLLKRDGLLMATFHNQGTAYALERLPWHADFDEDRIGRHVIGAGTPWSEGGPSVYYSRWWLRAHWGRAFEILTLSGGEDEEGEQGVLLARKRDLVVSAYELEQPEPGLEQREIAALLYSLRQSQAELAAVRGGARELARQRDEALEASVADRAGRWTGLARLLRRLGPRGARRGV